MEVVFGYEMQWRESASAVFWGNVSERYLKVARIYLDHRVLGSFFGPYLFHNVAVGAI